MKKYFTSAVAVFSLAGVAVASTPAEAASRYDHDYRNGGHGTNGAVVAGVAGLAIGALLVSGVRSRGYDRGYGGGYYGGARTGYYGQPQVYYGQPSYGFGNQGYYGRSPNYGRGYGYGGGYGRNHDRQDARRERRHERQDRRDERRYHDRYGY